MQDEIRVILSKVTTEILALKIRPKAIVLGGSVGRGEGTIIDGKLMSDIEIIVFTNLKPIVDQKLEDIAKKYCRDLDLEIVASLPRLAKSNSFLSYELQTGVLLFGDLSFLQRKDLTSKGIPKWEGFRELFNRLILLRDVEKSDDELKKYYAIMKTYLACAHAFLVFQGKYKPSYRERMNEFMKLSDKIDKALFDKIVFSFHLKLNGAQNLVQIRKKYDLQTAKKELLSVVDKLLKSYLDSPKDLDTNMKILDKKFPVKPLFSLYYYFYFLLRFKNVQPKLNILWNLKPTSLYHCMVLDELNCQQRLLELVNRFFYSPYSAIHDLTLLVKVYPYAKLKSDSEVK